MKIYQNLTTITTASYTIGGVDLYNTLKFTSGSGTMVATIPSSSAFRVSPSDYINCVQWSAAQVQFTTSSNFITLKSSNGLKTRTTGSSATLLNVGTDEWVLSGDVTT